MPAMQNKANGPSHEGIEAKTTKVLVECAEACPMQEERHIHISARDDAHVPRASVLGLSALREQLGVKRATKANPPNMVWLKVCSKPHLKIPFFKPATSTWTLQRT